MLSQVYSRLGLKNEAYIATFFGNDCNVLLQPFLFKNYLFTKTKKKKNLNFEANDYKLLFYLKELLKINEVSEYISL